VSYASSRSLCCTPSDAKLLSGAGTTQTRTHMHAHTPSACLRWACTRSTVPGAHARTAIVGVPSTHSLTCAPTSHGARDWLRACTCTCDWLCACTCNCEWLHACMCTPLHVRFGSRMRRRRATHCGTSWCPSSSAACSWRAACARGTAKSTRRTRPARERRLRSTRRSCGRLRCAGT